MIEILPAEAGGWLELFSGSLGVILAGVFTQGSLTQMKTSGFEVALFPYSSIVAAFASVGIDAEFDEDTPDATFQGTINQIDNLSSATRAELKKHLTESNAAPLTKFFAELEATLDRQIEQIILIPLHGHQNEFISVDEAIDFVSHHQSSNHFDGAFRKYEIIVKYTNGDKIEADFQDKKRAIDFLHYVQEGSAS